MLYFLLNSTDRLSTNQWCMYFTIFFCVLLSVIRWVYYIFPFSHHLYFAFFEDAKKSWTLYLLVFTLYVPRIWSQKLAVSLGIICIYRYVVIGIPRLLWWSGAHVGPSLTNRYLNEIIHVPRYIICRVIIL